MPSRTVAVGSASGLHARPAALFVACAAAQPVRVTIRTGDKRPVPAGSMLSVLALGARCGTEVTLEADGEDAKDALDALADLLVRDLDAEPDTGPPGGAPPGGSWPAAGGGPVPGGGPVAGGRPVSGGGDG